MGIYEELGVSRIINAMGTFTIYGGSKMSAQTLADMQDAASSFVDIRKLQRSLSTAIASLTHNEAAYISNGAAAGVYLCLLAAVSKKWNKKVRHLHAQDFAKSEVIVFRSHRNPYDISLEQLGVKMVELAYSNHSLPSPKEDILAAITPETVAIYYLESGWTAPGAPAIPVVVEAAKEAGIPIVMDAAAMLPPIENLWNYTAQGVDMVVFSGGKDLHGPQASGLIVGRSAYIDILLESGFPTHGYGRMFKTGREEMIGLYSALKQFVNSDQTARLEDAEAQVRLAVEMLSPLPFCQPQRSYPNEAGQPIPRVYVQLDGSVKASEVSQFLLQCDTPVVMACEGEQGFYLNPMSLTIEEMEYICKQIIAFAQTHIA